jgi:cyclophilin family peptidyl-prolyl cis-trans isomerase
MAQQMNPEFIPPEVIPGESLPQSSPQGSERPDGEFMHYHPPAAGTPQMPPMQQKATAKAQVSGPQAPEAEGKDPLAVLETDKGTITIRLFRKYAPQTVANFVELSKSGFYNGLTFHRVEPGFVIQGGDPNGNGTGDYIDPETKKPRYLPLEVSPMLRHNAAGVVAMAHAQSPNSGSCQFYITLAPEPALDLKYSIFGGVISGLDVVKKIAIGDKITSIKIEE